MAEYKDSENLKEPQSTASHKFGLAYAVVVVVEVRACNLPRRAGNSYYWLLRKLQRTRCYGMRCSEQIWRSTLVPQLHAYAYLLLFYTPENCEVRYGLTECSPRGSTRQLI